MQLAAGGDNMYGGDNMLEKKVVFDQLGGGDDKLSISR